MPDLKISETPAAATLTGTELVPIVQGGVNKKAVSKNIKGYLSYAALLTQTGTNAPVATVLNNDFSGPIVWTRSGPGFYIATLANAFPNNKTVFCEKVALLFPPENLGDPPITASLIGSTTSSFYLFTQSGSEANVIDGALSAHFIEIRVYP